jgi:hypothetical protein
LFKGNFAEKKHYLQKRCKKSTLAFLQKWARDHYITYTDPQSREKKERNTFALAARSI